LIGPKRHGLLGDSRRGDADVRLHSSSRLAMFKNEYGFDMLTVKGRLEASAASD